MGITIQKKKIFSVSKPWKQILVMKELLVKV